MELGKLKDKMPYQERVGPGGKKLKYITARQAQDRLDDVCGPENWKVEYKEISENLFAGVSIKIGQEWITKWDAGTESNIEKEKGHISDSFKRACVCWGIGRFLYPEAGQEENDFNQDNTPNPHTNKKQNFTVKQFKEFANELNEGGIEVGKAWIEENKSVYLFPDFVQKKITNAINHYKTNMGLSQEEAEKIFRTYDA